MRVGMKVLWGCVAALCAVALSFVTGLVNPDEKVNALWLVVAAACFYVLALRFYGRFLARRVMELDDTRITPAHRLHDGTNFYPANKYVLFGHHFAAIAGAGPLLGPVLAAQFGFLPGFLWLVIGAVLAGAVQDFIILVASMRRNGRSLPEIARDELGLVTGTATAVAVLFIAVVALAGLGLAVVNALYRNAWGTFTIAMTIPIGLLMGFYLQTFRPGRIGEVSAFGVSLLVLSVITGRVVAQSDFAAWFEYERSTLVWLLSGYGFLASAARVDALGATRLSLDLHETGRGAFTRPWGDPHGADRRNAARDVVRPWRGADYSRHPVPLSVHHDCVRGDLGISFSRLIRYDAQDD